jgi:hypothetical protein
MNDAAQVKSFSLKMPILIPKFMHINVLSGNQFEDTNICTSSIEVATATSVAIVCVIELSSNEPSINCSAFVHSCIGLERSQT